MLKALMAQTKNSRDTAPAPPGTVPSLASEEPTRG